VLAKAREIIALAQKEYHLAVGKFSEKLFTPHGRTNHSKTIAWL
jgi:hypothetical protein